MCSVITLWQIDVRVEKKVRGCTVSLIRVGSAPGTWWNMYLRWKVFPFQTIVPLQNDHFGCCRLHFLLRRFRDICTFSSVKTKRWLHNLSFFNVPRFMLIFFNPHTCPFRIHVLSFSFELFLSHLHTTRFFQKIFLWVVDEHTFAGLLLWSMLWLFKTVV